MPKTDKNEREDGAEGELENEGMRAATDVLPTEILRHTFSFLCPVPLSTASCVSKKWRSYANNKGLWLSHLQDLEIPEDTLNVIRDDTEIDGYTVKHIYTKARLLRARQADPQNLDSRHELTDIWQLILLSGEPRLIKKYMSKGTITLEETDNLNLNALRYAVLSGNHEALDYVLQQRIELFDTAILRKYCGNISIEIVYSGVNAPAIIKQLLDEAEQDNNTQMTEILNAYLDFFGRINKILDNFFSSAACTIPSYLHENIQTTFPLVNSLFGFAHNVSRKILPMTALFNLALSSFDKSICKLSSPYPTLTENFIRSALIMIKDLQHGSFVGANLFLYGKTAYQSQCPDILRLLGDCKRGGLIIEQDTEAALDLYKRALEQLTPDDIEKKEYLTTQIEELSLQAQGAAGTLEAKAGDTARPSSAGNNGKEEEEEAHLPTVKTR